MVRVEGRCSVIPKGTFQTRASCRATRIAGKTEWAWITSGIQSWLEKKIAIWWAESQAIPESPGMMDLGITGTLRKQPSGIGLGRNVRKLSICKVLALLVTATLISTPTRRSISTCSAKKLPFAGLSAVGYQEGTHKTRT